MGVRFRSFFLAICSIAILTSGCSVKLNPKLPKVEIPAEAQGTAGLPEKVGGLPETLGRGTFTVFAIPVASVKLIKKQDGGKVLSEKFAETLRLAGYEPVPYTGEMHTGLPAGAPAFSMKVEQCSFMNYTWLFPIVPTWGKMDVSVALAGSDGKTLWTERYRGKGMNFYWSFSGAVNSALTDVLNQFYRDISAPDFKMKVATVQGDRTASAVPPPGLSAPNP